MKSRNQDLIQLQKGLSTGEDGIFIAAAGPKVGGPICQGFSGFKFCFLQIYNSWYDERAGKAKPIAELLDALQRGDLLPRVNPKAAEHAKIEAGDQENRPTPNTWNEADDATKRQIIDSYRLAYLAGVTVNWCPALGTVLSNEEVDSEGRSDRGRHPVFRRPLEQWMLRITSYADRLIGDLDGLDWPEPIILMQRHWIGRSTGAEVAFPLADHWRVDNGTWMRTEESNSE